VIQDEYARYAIMSNVTKLPVARLGAVIKWKRQDIEDWSFGRVVEVDENEILTHGIATRGNDPYRLEISRFLSLKEQGLAGHATPDDIRAHLTRQYRAGLRCYHKTKRALEEQLENNEILWRDEKRRIRTALNNMG
jgi:hypothetical protein